MLNYIKYSPRLSISTVYSHHTSIGIEQFGPEGVSDEAATLSDQCLGVSGKCLAAVQLLRVTSRSFGLRQEASVHSCGAVDEKRSSIPRSAFI